MPDGVIEPFMTHSFAYLEAMGITQWELRQQSENDSQSLDNESQNSQSENTQNQNILNQSRQLEDHQLQGSQAQVITEQQDLNKAQPAVVTQSFDANQSDSRMVTPDTKAPPVETSHQQENQVAETAAKFSVAEPDSSSKSANLSGQQGQRFMVLGRGKQWKNDALTVLCRHEPGQPSESYLLRGNPSKIVQNMLKALNFFMHHEVATQILQQCNLAQLASTSLSEQAKAASEVFADHKPKALLVMGAATANHLMGYEQSMGQWQVKTWQTDDGIPFVVTYHPYEIHSSPILKRQVMSDLLSLISLSCQL